MRDESFLGRVAWLQELDESDRALLDRTARPRTFARGATVFEPSDRPESVYLLESGRIRIYRLSAAGEEATLGWVSPQEVFGELPSFGAFPRESFARAVESSRVWKIPIRVFRPLVQRHSELAIEVTRQIADRMKRVESQVESLILRDVRSRLAAALIELVEHFGQRDGDRWTLDLPLSQSDLGTLIGASRQSVNTALAGFREAGWLRQQGSRLTLLEADRLRELVEAADEG